MDVIFVRESFVSGLQFTLYLFFAGLGMFLKNKNEVGTSSEKSMTYEFYRSPPVPV